MKKRTVLPKHTHWSLLRIDVRLGHISEAVIGEIEEKLNAAIWHNVSFRLIKFIKNGIIST